MRTLPLKRFVDSARPITYGIVQAGEHVEAGVPYIRPVDMTEHDGVRDIPGLRRTAPEIALAYRRSMVRGGDLVVTIGPSFGKTMIVPELLSGANLTQGTAKIAPAPGVDVRFLRWALRSALAVGYWSSAVSGATFRALNLEPLSLTPIPWLPLDHQRAIADYLDAETARIDALIAKKRRMSDLVAERTDAAVDHLFEPFEIVPLRRLAVRISVGIAEAATHAYSDSGVPLIRSTNIRADRIDETDVLHIEPWFAERNRAKSVFAGDILTVRTGNAGVSAVVPRHLDRCQCFTQLITTLRPPNNPELVSAALNSALGRTYFGQASWGSAQANISVPLLAAAPVPIVPPAHDIEVLMELRRINRVGSALQGSLTRQVDLLVEHRQALITAAVTGELAIPGVAA